VAGLAFEYDRSAGLARDGRDHAEWGTGPLEQRTLLDVQLEIGARMRGRLVRSEPASSRLSLLVHVQPAESGPAAEEPARERAAFLVPERNDRHRAAWRPCRPETLRGVEPGEDAERAVEATSLGDGVEMGADPELGLGVLLAPEAAEEVAPCVRLDLELGFRQPAGNDVVRLLLGRAQPGPVGPDSAADRVDAVEPLQDPCERRVPFRAQSANGFDGFGLVETRTLFDSIYASRVSMPSSRPNPDCL
jgi:hypothetical protein